MGFIFAKTARLEQAWAHDVRLTIDGGVISGIEASAQPGADDSRVDILLPALANVHSHAFQRAMAGMTEFRGADGVSGDDSFWTWRQLMYRFVDQLQPEQVEAVAALVFMEMQETGFASVGEFHYLHHQGGGEPYDNRAETSLRIIAAAATTGIGLTHLPVLYSYGGAGKAALEPGQLRFGNDVEGFNAVVDEAAGAVKALSFDARIGIAPHSLRATSPKDLTALLAAHPTGPVHIHISEQEKEVAEIKTWLGARPVHWLLDNVVVDRRWCLVHATHMNDGETRAMARTGAVAGLCPITEANLGDGIFNGSAYLAHGGSFAIGSDSNIRISLGEELRMLEYSQRLRDKKRNIMTTGAGSVGETLYLGAARGGAQALEREAGEIRVGALADLVAIDRQTPALCALKDQQLLDGLVFAAGDDVVSDLWSAGRHMVRAGRHVARDKIVGAYRKAISQLMSRI